MQAGVSIIICCYNSEGRIAETIKHIAGQAVPTGIDWEVILIDNASTDNTTGVATATWTNFNLTNAEFKILNEYKPGKNFAFEKGIKEAKFEYILTCDDDNRLAPDYIATGFSIMKSDSSIGVLGGCGIFDPEQPMNQEVMEFKAAYVNGPQTWAENDKWVYGAGSFCRRSAFLSFYKNGWQQVTTGRSGTKLICGEDVEICFMFCLNSYKIIADERLSFKHFVPLRRQNIGYLLKMNYWVSYSYFLLSGYIMLIEKDQRTINQKIKKMLIHHVKALILHKLKLTRQLMTGKPISIQQKLTSKTYIGFIWSVFKNRGRVAEHFHLLKSITAISKNRAALSIV